MGNQLHQDEERYDMGNQLHQDEERYDMGNQLPDVKSQLCVFYHNLYNFRWLLIHLNVLHCLAI